MAGGSNFRSDKLEEAIHTYDVPVADDIEWDNEKMIRALGNYFMSLEPEKYSWGARYVQSLGTPMLCKHLKEATKGLEINLAESDDYVAEVKMNGVRCLATYSPEVGFEFFSRDESSSNYLNGNFTNKYLFINNGVITEPSDYKGFDYRFVLDGELLVECTEENTSTISVSVEDFIQSILSSKEERAKAIQREGYKLKFVVFDVLYFEKNPKVPADWTPEYNFYEEELTPETIAWVESKFSTYLKSAGYKSAGRAKKLYQFLASLKHSNKNDCRRLPFKKRRELRHLIINFLQANRIPISEVEGEDTYKVAFTDSLLREGAEGSIIKNIHAPYISGLRTSRNHRAALKIKQSIENMLSSDEALVEDFDVFITSANPPKSDRITDMIGALNCSIYIKDEDGTVREHEIASISGITHEWKRKLAQIDVNTGKIELNPEYKDKVISINGLALTKTKLKFQHAVLRDKGVIQFKAKNPSECTWDIGVLKEMALVRGKE